MNVTDLGIIDGNIEKSDSYKVLLMDKVIHHFLPLFRDEIEKKKSTMDGHKSDYNKLVKEITKTRKVLAKLDDDYKIELAKQDILFEIDYLYNRDVLYGNNKKIVLDVLDGFNKLDLKTLSGALKSLKALNL